MTTGLAIAGVTAVLQYQLQNLYAAPGGPFTTTVGVSCLAPDQVQAMLGKVTDPQNQVNLFLHQVTHNAGWRNADRPSVGADGKTQLSNPPLALDLHYLLTVYASDYWQAEALLGYGVQMLHDTPILARAGITNALSNLATPFPSSPLISFLQQSGLADQVEMIKITPAPLGREEMAWLWTALKADYRPTYPFSVTVVLIQSQRPTTLAPPVISRDIQALPINPAQLLEVQLPIGQFAAASVDTVIVTGEFLAGLGRLLLSNSRLGVQFTVPVSSVINTSFSFVPDPTKSQPAGLYGIEGQFLDAGSNVIRATNVLSMALAPTLPDQVATVASSATAKTVKVSFFPSVLAGQDVSLALSTTTTPLFSAAAPAQPFTGSASSLSFVFPPTLPSGALLGRLIVDGVSSNVRINPTSPPTYAGPMVTV